MKESILANRYISAFINTLADADKHHALAKGYAFVSAIATHATLQDYLKSPLIDSDQKELAIQKLGTAFKVSTSVTDLLHLLIKKKRIHLIPHISTALKQALQNHDHQREATITTPVEASKADQDQLLTYITKTTGYHILPTFKVDADILGGFIVTMEETIIDASLKNTLDKLRLKISQ
jgi:F-type H+-transporting ATPase subunit delta